MTYVVYDTARGGGNARFFSGAAFVLRNREGIFTPEQVKDMAAEVLARTTWKFRYGGRLEGEDLLAYMVLYSHLKHRDGEELWREASPDDLNAALAQEHANLLCVVQGEGNLDSAFDFCHSMKRQFGYIPANLFGQEWRRHGISIPPSES
jgi:hypothetical protein